MSGQRKTTIREVADAAGVSTATVSLVYNGKGSVAASTRERVLATGSRLGYRPGNASRAFRTGRSRVIGIAVGHGGTPIWELTYLPYYRGLIAGAAMEALEHGYSITVMPVGESSEGLEGPIAPDGIILTDLGPDDSLIAEALAAGMVVVSASGYGGTVRSPRLRTVQFEIEGAVPAALDELLAAGASRPSFFRGAVDDEYTAGSQRAYERWCEVRGIQPLVYVLQHGMAAIDGARALISGGSGKCDAVYCINETYASAITAAAGEADISIPDVFGVAVAAEVYSVPVASRLVYLHLDHTKLGAQCARAAIDMLEGRLSGDVSLPVPLIAPGTGKLPAPQDPGSA